MTEDYTPYEPNRADGLISTGGGGPLEAPRAAAPGHLVGRVEAADLRTERFSTGESSSTRSILSFRLRTPDGRLSAVELRGSTLIGTVRDGDWVEVPDRRERGGQLAPDRLANLTTGSQVSVGGRLSKGLRIVFITIFALILLGALIIFGMVAAGFAAWNGFRSFN